MAMSPHLAACAWLRLKSSPSNLADTVSPVSVITGSQCPDQTARQVQGPGTLVTLITSTAVTGEPSDASHRARTISETKHYVTGGDDGEAVTTGRAAAR